jgi:hypothetical protein
MADVSKTAYSPESGNDNITIYWQYKIYFLSYAVTNDLDDAEDL